MQSVRKRTRASLPPKNYSRYRAQQRGRYKRSYRREYAYDRRRTSYARNNIRTGGFTGMENKFLDCEISATTVTTSWAAHNPAGVGCTDSLSVPAQGVTESNRIGRVYTINQVMVQGVVEMAAQESVAAPIQDHRIRIIIYWDQQTNSAAATTTDIMDAGGSDDITGFRNLQNTHRFRVLYDKTLVFRYPGQTNEGAVNLFAHGKKVIPFKFYKKCNIKVQCDATTADVSSCTDNNIGLGAIAEAGPVAQQPTIRYSSRIRFTG